MAAAPSTGLGQVAVSDIDGVTVYHGYEHHLQSIDPHTHPAPFVLRKWLNERASIAALSGRVYEGDCQFQLQVRTGPQSCAAFHVQSGEEWLYMMSGSAALRIIDGREVHTHVLQDGACFLVAGGTPKSLQLDENSSVLVMTRQRKTAESYPHFNKTHQSPHLTHLNKNAAEPLDAPDQLLWLCGQCGAVAHSVDFQCTDYYAQYQQLTSDFEQRASAGAVKCAACSVPYVAASATGSASLPASAAAFPSINASTHSLLPYHLLSWIETNRHLLAPPVGNKMIHGRGAQWKVMIVGGPNERTDYHIDDGEEWFLMVQGDMCLKVVDAQGTVFRDIPIREGESFLLPAHVPHSPQRAANTVGLVIERERFTHELDGLRWYCSNEACRAHLHTFSFRCADLGTQLKTLITHWYDESAEGVKRRTCNKCGTVEKKPDTLAKIKQYSH